MVSGAFLILVLLFVVALHRLFKNLFSPLPRAERLLRVTRTIGAMLLILMLFAALQAPSRVEKESRETLGTTAVVSGIAGTLLVVVSSIALWRLARRRSSPASH